MNRSETIASAVRAHNAFLEAWNRARPEMRNDNHWDEADLRRHPDRFYLVESMGENPQTADDRRNDSKSYEPRVEVRRLLRSAEARKRGLLSTRYLSTVPFKYRDLEEANTDPKAYEERIYRELTKK